MICPKCDSLMESLLTRNSVLVDVCTSCLGHWLDQGEINFFIKDPRPLKKYDEEGLQDLKPTEDKCPSCPSICLNTGKIPGFSFQVEECPSCLGLYLDKNEIAAIGKGTQAESFQVDKKVGRALNRKAQNPRVGKRSGTSLGDVSRRGPIIKLPSLGFVSMAVLGSMYAVIFGLMVFVSEAGLLPESSAMLIVVGFVFLQFFFSPIIMDWSLRLFGSLDWVELEQLPAHIQDFVKKICTDKKIPIPSFGIINDSSPQAYTYGRTPRSARLVLSKGIFELLTEEEVEAVVAHEMGHIKHWDFVVMTVAQLVPVLFYHIYRICMRAARSGGKKEKGNGQFVIAAVIAYIAYSLAQYLVMFVSRLREYWADKFSVYYTKDPNALIYALTKIGFGLVTYREDDNKKSRDSHSQKARAVQAMGIMNIGGSKEMAIAFQGQSGGAQDVQSIKEAMSWDLWSPWASYYELHSTHPLTAKRINTIAAHGLNLGVEADIIFDLEKPESYWDDFVGDLVFLILPGLLAILFTAFSLVVLAPSLSDVGFFDVLTPFVTGLSLGGLIKLFRIYPSGPFLKSSVLALLKKVKVSPVRAYPVCLKGKVIGRGEAGNIFSEDMILRDQTGIIFLDYQQPLAIFNWFFALFKIKKFQGQEVLIKGWYRRAPVPYIEVKTIASGTDSSTAYSFHYKLVAWILLPLIYFGVLTYFKMTSF